LVDRYAVRRVFDVGCGEGNALRSFHGLGCTAVGLDGLWYNVAHASRWGTAIAHDLCKGPFPLPSIDLVWCCELVEHVAEEHLANLLGTITCGRVLAMTHAVPGQEGWHHVNCKDGDYWRFHLDAWGFDLDEDATRKSLSLAGEFWGQSGLIFTRRA
jgi:SAM-dependent methyltransferase